MEVLESETEQKISICAKLLINAELLWPCIGPQGSKKEYHQIWEASLQPKNAQTWPQVSNKC